MKREIVLTGDGSHSVSVPDMQVMYHSRHGAIQESKHVFIVAGLQSVRVNQLDAIRIFEMGFGTGLNALLTCIEAEKYSRHIYYTAIEQNPLTSEETEGLNYGSLLQEQELSRRLNACDWGRDVAITSYFTLNKQRTDLLNWLDEHAPPAEMEQGFDLIYYDAFSPQAQPELWKKEIFEKLYALIKPNGLLVTYCSKGDVRRAMAAAGFRVVKLPGPPGKREMVRAEKQEKEVK